MKPLNWKVYPVYRVGTTSSTYSIMYLGGIYVK